MRCWYHVVLLSRQQRPISHFPTTRSTSPLILYDYAEDGSPSDYDTADLPPDIKEVAVDEKVEDVLIRDALKRELLLLASVTDRGTYATKDEQDIVIDLVAQLEALNPTEEPASHCEGDWDLCYSSTQFFRSSPFFQSIRVAVGEDNKEIAENGFDLHDQATVGSRVGRVRQIITSSQLVSEVDLEVGMLPGIPLSKAKGTVSDMLKCNTKIFPCFNFLTSCLYLFLSSLQVVTSASLDVVDSSKWELRVQNTKVRGSNVPFLNMFLDNLEFDLPIGDFYNSLQGKVPVIPMKTFYVDEAIRITRDIDDNFFVFVRES